MKFKLNFGFKNDRLSLCISEADRPEKRNYLSVEKELRLFDKDGFDCKFQKFCEESRNAKSNNRILADIMRKSEKKIKEGNPKDGKEAIRLLKGIDKDGKKKQPRKIEESDKEERAGALTFGKWLKELGQRSSFRVGALPSTNQVKYKVLYNKMKKDPLASKPVSSVTDNDILDFAMRWSESHPKSYENDMIVFAASINRAHREGFRNAACPSTWREYMPVADFSIEDAAKGTSVLSVSEYQKFCELAENERKVNKRLYYDVCLLIYELKMRPVDVLRMRKSGISGEEYVYLPTKKKNIKARQRHVVKVLFTERASAIIKKYWKSTGNDYLLPFKGNLSEPDLTVPSEYIAYLTKSTRFLRKISYALRNIEWIGHERGTSYLFRHSAFTHEINACKKPIMQIAKEGGTSVAMLEKHYYNYFIK